MPFDPVHPVPVFPLPGVVMFPGVCVPLHVYELRYRALVRDALRGERVIALALLSPGAERDYHGSPGFHPLGCLARMDEVRWQPDDCYDLKVHGLARARFGATVREFPYRAVRCQVLPQDPFSEDDALVLLERRALIEVGTRCLRRIEAAGGAAGAIDEGLGFEALVNTLCMGLAGDPDEKLALLEMDSVIDRGRRVRERMEEWLRQTGRAGAPGGESN